jgi:hypothetical protein
LLQKLLDQFPSALRIALNFMKIAPGSAVGWQLPFHHLSIQQHAGEYVVQPMQYLVATVAHPFATN